MFAPHSRWRAAITPAGRGSGIQPADTRTPAERHRALSWAQRLKRVFKLDLQSCEGCGGQVRVIACIEAPLVIGKILAHLETRGLQRADAGLAGPAAQATASRREWLSGVGFVRLILGCAEYSWPAGGYDCRPE